MISIIRENEILTTECPVELARRLQIVDTNNTKPPVYQKKTMKFSDFLKQKFGGKTLKIAVDAGFECPHQQIGGCAWCANDSFSAASATNEPPLSAANLHHQIIAGIARAKKKHSAVERFLVYFQPRTNTNAPIEKLRELYETALLNPQVVGITIGTRPDCVDEKIIALLAEIAEKKFVQIEYGLQSINDSTLTALNRGHTTADFLHAMKITRKRGIYICAHLIVGLPGDTLADSIHAARLLAQEKIDGIKIHNLLVVKNTPLAEPFIRAPFALPTLPEYAQTVAAMLNELPIDTTEQRLCANVRHPDQLIAPQWALSPTTVMSAIAQARNRGARFGIDNSQITRNPTVITKDSASLGEQ